MISADLYKMQMWRYNMAKAFVQQNYETYENNTYSQFRDHYIFRLVFFYKAPRLPSLLHTVTCYTYQIS